LLDSNVEHNIKKLKENFRKQIIVTIIFTMLIFVSFIPAVNSEVENTLPTQSSENEDRKIGTEESDNGFISDDFKVFKNDNKNAKIINNKFQKTTDNNENYQNLPNPGSRESLKS